MIQDVSLERIRSFANENFQAIALQRRRLQSNEPEDETFVNKKFIIG